MSKLRVHDMAGEFGISADEVMGLLRTMEVAVRSHLSPLTDDQVARVRARWEREKRVRAEKQAAPAAPARRRRGAATAVVVPEPVAAPVEADAAGSDASPVRRRRKAVDVQAAADAAAEVAAAEAAANEVVEHARAAERAERAEREAAEAAVAAARAEQAAAARAAEDAEARAAASQRVATEPTATPASAERKSPADVGVTTPRHESPRASMPSPLSPASAGNDRPRPRPITPGAPRPRAAGSSSPFPPRPVASASPGGFGGPTRRDDRRPVGGGPQSGNPPTTGAGAGTASRGRKKGKRGSVDQEVVDANIAKTMASMRGVPTRGGRVDRRGIREEAEASRLAEVEREKKLVRVNEFITVSELAQILKVSPTEIVGFAFKNLGLMITVNQRLDFDQIEIVAGEFGFQAVREDEYQAEEVGTVIEDTPEDMQPRPPIVTIMGHVDHGKTSLLDYIRKANVVAGEAGGITQHIGAYHVQLPGGKMITFLDTPGHEAFTAMRARGAQVTDEVILVVAADDAVMPQTIEAISHAKNAGVPMIVAINKVDLPQANAMKVKQDLLQHGVVLEEFGGTTLSTEISAKKGTGIDALLEQILLQAELLDLKANPDKRATGTVVEAQLDAGKGPVATVLVQSGTLRVGDDFIVGMFSGRVRALLDERGKAVKSAGPAIPVQVLGMQGVPMAGDQLLVVEDAGAAREVAQRRERLDREAKSRRTTRGVTLEDFMTQSTAGEVRSLRILIKADQGGPAEALADALQQLGTSEVKVEVVHRGVGAITESDILLARASGAIIIGFHVRPDNNARTAAERENVDIKLYRIIYEAVADVRLALEGMLRPEQREIILGEAEVLETFKVPKIGLIAGCAVRSGIIRRDARVRVIRDSVELFEGAIHSLRRFKDDVKEVREGFECGIGIENFNDLKVGDRIENYRTEEVARTLESAPQS
ncbi:MAG TPA: translation initiation factor IF-2 [Gemmatimonadaceae bacterium]|nr:translation initiation factor IF-2 [Gemmatimonadaceae bacterium]